ncbi:MAG: transcriptional regulator, partial [Nitrososphaeria archaeon]
MYLPCEVVLKTVLPNIRALVAKELSEKYRMKQVEIAQVLGISQSAVSMYLTGNRGTAIDLGKNKDIYDKIELLSKRIFDRSLTQEEYISRVCEICKIVRGKGLLCQVHRQYLKPFELKECSYCLNKV